jgi:hypothetical protein
MEKANILHFVRQYDADRDQDDADEERVLGEQFRSNRCVTKPDLKRVVAWKFQGRLKGRQQRTLRLLDPVPASYVLDVSILAFSYEDDEIRLKLLRTINGIGTALSSVILAFYDPLRYGVLDIHAWRGLFGKETKLDFAQRKHVLKFFKRLREISSETGIPCRDIEKAYFIKDKIGTTDSSRMAWLGD